MRTFLATWLLALAVSMPAGATSVLPLYLDQIADTASVAFEGTCLENRSERDAATNLIVTYTTFAVRDVLKGSVGTTYTIKQIGGSLDGEALQYRVEGIPRFAVGQDYVVFLAGVSSVGFSSPIGLAQGRFHVRGDGAARRIGNGRDLRDMTSRMGAHLPPTSRSAMRSTIGPVKEMDLDEFKKAVRGHLGAAR